MTEIIIYDICAALVGWGTSVVLSVSMKMGYIPYSLVWYTHNNQLYWYEDGGTTRSNNILMDVTLEV